MSCNRCGTDQTNLEYCVYCAAYNELQAAYARLQDNAMTDEDILLLDEVRSTCHGGGAAVAMTIRGEGELRLENMQEMLREASKKIVAVTDKYGGWDRIARIRGIK
jgi:hypothetical protein